MIYLLHNTLDHIMLLAVTDNVMLEESKLRPIFANIR